MSATTIIVADDDRDICLLIQLMLAADGYETVEARDGAEVLQALETTDAAALITDVQMPHLDGVDLVCALRHHKRTSKLPVIAMSGLPPDEPRIQELESNTGVRMLFKPFTATQMRTVLGDVLGTA